MKLPGSSARVCLARFVKGIILEPRTSEEMPPFQQQVSSSCYWKQEERDFCWADVCPSNFSALTSADNRHLLQAGHGIVSDHISVKDFKTRRRALGVSERPPLGEGVSTCMNGHLHKWDESREEAFGAEKLSTLHKVRVQVPGKARARTSCSGVPHDAPT